MNLVLLLTLLGAILIGTLGRGIYVIQIGGVMLVVAFAWIVIDQGPAGLERRLPEVIDMMRPHLRLIVAALLGLVGGEVLRRVFQGRRNA